VLLEGAGGHFRTAPALMRSADGVRLLAPVTDDAVADELRIGVTRWAMK